MRVSFCVSPCNHNFSSRLLRALRAFAVVFASVLFFIPAAQAQPAPPATKPVLELKLRTQLKGHTVAIKSVTCSADGRTVASGDANGLVILWDRPKGKEIRKLAGPDNVAVITLSFSTDGKRL